MTFDLIFVGYLGSEGMIEAVEYFLSCFPDTEVIIDPIMGDHGRYYTNFDSSYGESMRRLLPYASIIMPNITEGCLLTQTSCSENMIQETILTICQEFGKAGAKKIDYDKRSLRFWKKGNCPLNENGEMQLALKKSAFACEYHGTGDTFDGVFVGAYLNNKSLEESLELAHAFVYACMKESERYDYEEREGLIIERNLYMLV